MTTVEEPLPEQRPIPTLLVDDSTVALRFARMALSALPGCSIVGEARRGREAVALALELRPAVVVLDLDLPELSGLEVIAEIMAASPTPIVVMSGHLDGLGEESEDARSRALAARALAAGAVVLLPKPKLADGRDGDDHAAALRRAVALASRARVITHPRGRVTGQPRVAPVALMSPVSPVSRAAAPAVTPQVPRQAAPAAGSRPGARTDLIVIGASTGGPAALAALLSSLPADLDVPVLVIQHMSEGFMEGLAGWLDSTCGLPVAVARDGQRLKPGTVTLAPDSGNAEVLPGLVVRLSAPEPGQFHIPSVDLAFASVARVCGSQAVGVLLTGMGRDGAQGLAELREAGCLTLAQDEATSVVWGMPGAAVARGAATHVLALGDLADALLAAVPA